MIQEKQARSSPCTPTNTKLEERKIGKPCKNVKKRRITF